MTKDELFKQAVEITLQFEGGYSNNPLDKGGETNFGISKKSWPDIDIKNLTKEKAIEIYKQYYWDGTIASMVDDDETAMKIFDLGVQMGLNGVKHRIEDVIGPADDETNEEIAHAINTMGPEDFLPEFEAVCADYYEQRVIDDPKDNVWLGGWLKRVYY